MLSKNKFLFLFLIEICVAFDLKFKVGYCSYQCNNEKDNSKNEEKIKGYYWREFNGDIPPDAFPVGNEIQSPQAYIGHVVDQNTQGSYVVTIFAGQPHVYLAINDTVKKMYDHIQILCSQEPENLGFLPIRGNKPDKAHFVEGGNVLHGDYTIHYVIKISKDQCGMAYVAGLNNPSERLSYTTSQGTVQVASEEEEFVLYYLPGNTKKQTNDDHSIQHRIHVMISEDSVIPKFYRKRKYGYCSSTCTNMDLGGQNSPTEGYYWKPNNVDQSDRVPAGSSKKFKTLYIAEGFNTYYNTNFVGKGEPYANETISSYEIPSKSMVYTTANNRVLCSKNLEYFKWVDANSSSVTMYKEKMLIPGLAPNGTPIAIGRATTKNEIYPGAVILTDNPAVEIVTDNLDSLTLNDFQVLLYEGPSGGNSAMQISQIRSFFNNLQNAVGLSVKLKL